MAQAGYYPGTTGTSGGSLDLETWMRTIEHPISEKAVFWPLCDKGDRPYSAEYVRKWDKYTSNTLTDGAAATYAIASALTWNAGNTSRVTITPAGIYCAVGYTENQKQYVEADLDGGIRTGIEDCLAEGADAACLATVPSLTAVYGGSTTHISASALRTLGAALDVNSNGGARTGEGMVYGVFSPAAKPGLLAIPEVANADYRGDSENPNVRGTVVKAMGLTLRYTNAVYDAGGNGAEGVIFIPSAFVVAWNQRPTVIKQQDGLEHELIGYMNLGSAIKWDDRAYCVRTVNSVVVG